MTAIGAWLDARRPPAPSELRSAIDEALGDGLDGSGAEAELLHRATLRSLDSALARPGRVRASAFELLAADALLTYGCEAALESEDPHGALFHLIAGVLEPSDPR